jgi:hypothetical protein
MPWDQRFKSRTGTHEFLTLLTAIHNTCNIQSQLFSRPTVRRFRVDAANAWTTAMA